MYLIKEPLTLLNTSHTEDEPARPEGVRSKTDNGEEVLTTRMKGRLKDEEANYKKVRRRDHGNNLLAANINTLVKEEGKLNSNLPQVREAQ